MEELALFQSVSKGSDIPNDLETANQYIDWLVALGLFESIWVHGSRSPLRKKEVESHSDWDLILISKIPKLKIVQPQKSGQLYADIVIFEREDQIMTKAVKIWPEDSYGVLNGIR